jgi:hypothetical protein
MKNSMYAASCGRSCTPLLGFLSLAFLFSFFFLFLSFFLSFFLFFVKNLHGKIRSYNLNWWFSSLHLEFNSSTKGLIIIIIKTMPLEWFINLLPARYLYSDARNI